jgi:hypothetical protein
MVRNTVSRERQLHGVRPVDQRDIGDLVVTECVPESRHELEAPGAVATARPSRRQA